MDVDGQDSDEGVELSPISDYSDYPGEVGQDSRPPVVEAKTVYVLMPKNVPVSRFSRLQWFLDNLNCAVNVPNLLKQDTDSEGLEIISAIPFDSTNIKASQYLITTRTEVVFLAQSYRFVYCLDMSPSQSTVDIDKSVILLDEILKAFRASLEGLCKQFTIPGNTLIFYPCIYLTVIVNTPFFMSPAQQVLVKGVHVTSKNLTNVIKLIETQFHVLEKKIAHVSAVAHEQMDQQGSQSDGIVGGLFDLPENEPVGPSIPMVSPDANFVNMLRYSMLAISLLPENSLSHILVITDGVVAMPDSNIMESLLYQLHYDSITLSFIKVSSKFHPHSSAGYVAYTDLLNFLSHSTSGTCLETIVNVVHEPTMMINIYHELYLLWSFHARNKYVMQRQACSDPKWMPPKRPILLSKRQTEENVNASFILLLARRIREGYTVEAVHYSAGYLEVKLSLQWKSFVFIQYNLKSQWPILKNVALFEVQISAPYEFLYDITCLMKKESKSSYRQAVIERFWIRLTQLASKDTNLAQQLSSFHNSNVWYSPPESVRGGIPVFILNSNIIHDACRLSLVPSDTSCSKFVNIWQPVSQIETNSWRKWFHTQKLSLILKHDHPLPKHLHLANSSGRFQVVQCRQAATSLYGFLSKWASFVLIDNNTYLKLLYSELDKPPSCFCIVRISSKLPCSVLNIGFSTGTPGVVRQQLCNELKAQLSSLTYHSSPPKSKENLCCTLLQKPLEKFLIRYERMPSDFTTVIFPDGTQPPDGSQGLPPSPFAGTLFTTLSRYLYHRRWVWSATHSSNLRLDHVAISRILNTLTRMRIKEGFSFAHSSSGIITMVLELFMDNGLSCVVQYVLFPPHSALWGEGDIYSGSEEDIDPDSEAEPELQMVTEVWIEPQFGLVRTDNQRMGYMNDKPYYEIADVIKQTDLKCIHSLLTLEHISLLCQDRRPHRLSMNSRLGKNSFLNSSFSSSSEYNASVADNGYPWLPSCSQRIQHINFNFDPINILPLCQLTELLFSMFVECRGRYTFSKYKSTEKANQALLENILYHLHCMSDQELDFNRAESDIFTQHILKRHRNKSPNICPISPYFDKVVFQEASSLDSRWRCFIKGISPTHIILTFVPASLQDLKALIGFDTQLPAQSDDAAGERTSSRESNYSDVPINVTNTLPLPVYVFDCPLSQLVNAYINDSELNLGNDCYEDHRFKSESFVQEEIVRLKEDDGSSPEPKSEESEQSDGKNSIRHHCKGLVLLYSKCFTMSLFSALHKSYYVHSMDVQAAMDQCEDNVYEIDITKYILTICGHLKHAKSDMIEVDELGISKPCKELKSLHNLIKDKFSQTIRQSFEPIPTNSDYYYCRNLSPEKKEEKQNDSDDEISNHPSDVIDFIIEDAQPLENTEITTDMSPLFLHLVCTIHYNGTVINTAVSVLPTCLAEVVQSPEFFSNSFDRSKLRITLDMLYLTLPHNVQNVISDFSPKGMRTTSFSSDFQPSNASTSSGTSLTADFKEESTMYLSESQKQAMVTLCEEIKWLLVEEIVTSLLDFYPVTSSTLAFVKKHISMSSPSRPSCKLDVIDLNFVYECGKSHDKFVEEFSKLQLYDYTLCKEGDLYYLAKLVCTEESKETGCFVANTEKKVLPLQEAGENEDNDADSESQHSDSSSLNESILGTDGGYEEDISEDEDNYDWVIVLDEGRPHLPNFWLILQVEQDSVTVYFHCRFLELPTTVVASYLSAQRAMIDLIRDLCKRVNQALLLQSLDETRICNQLLEPEDSWQEWPANDVTAVVIRTSSYSRLKSMDDTNDEVSENCNNSALAEASLKYKPGYFSCPVVWEVPFILHSRLKTGPGKLGISRGVLALKSILDKFSVSNRDNMFVYKDKNSNVFYLRLQEHPQNSCGKSSSGASKPGELEHIPVSRSPSIASLPLGKVMTQSEYSSSSVLSGDARPRVRSFGEKESNDPTVEDVVVLKVHGITEAGDDIRCELVQVLQNRLDDAVLESLSVMLARNSMCPLTPEDVHFLQKPFKLPELIIRVSIQEFCLKWLSSFVHYLQQNLLQFLNIPKYTDSRCHFHFKDYSEQEQLDKIKDDNIFIYNQGQNPSSGNRGIACIALAIINNADKTNAEIDWGTFQRKTFEELVHSNLIDGDELPEAYLEFRLWMQGRVNTENLSIRLKTATSQATWDLIMEHRILLEPFCTTDRPGKPISAESVGNNHEFDSNTLIDFSFGTKITSQVLQLGKKVDCPATFKRRKRLIATGSSTQRSTTIEESDGRPSVGRIKLDFYELGDSGTLSDTLATYLQEWLEFGCTMLTPSVRKHSVTLASRHLTAVTVKEVQSIVSHLARESPKAFGLMPGNANIFVPYITGSHPERCIVISRNFEQWKACVDFNGAVDFPELFVSENMKHTQKFSPLVTSNNVFVPRQRILWALIQTDSILIYTYNWPRETVDKLMEYTTNLGLWLSARSSFLNSVVSQKLGLFYNQLITRKAFIPTNNPYIGFVGDLDHMLKFPKERLRSRGSISQSNPPPVMLEAFRDSYKQGKTSCADLVNIFTVEMHEIRRSDKKYREEMKKLAAIHQTRAGTTSTQQLQIQLQNSRIIHYCHTPLLFLQSWRLQSAATRDQSLYARGQVEAKELSETWHQELCNDFLVEYKLYLQTLGFSPLLVETSKKVNKKDAKTTDSTIYLQKTILGGILTFTVKLQEPFYTSVLHVVECGRLQTAVSRASINRFTLTFLDECDRIRVLMHLHSFAYDFHLRSIHNYLSNTVEHRIPEKYQVVHFLDDFMKYYNKAPNFARNLLYTDAIVIGNLMTEGKQLYDYLLTNVAQYNFDIFTMYKGDPKEVEYVLVKATNSQQVTYKDALDMQHTDDFAVTVIICNTLSTNVPRDNTLCLKYYLILISRRAVYPKSEIERTLGKFRAVSQFTRNPCANDDDTIQHEDVTGLTDASEIPETTNMVTESVNYLGYFSSHEQAMQQLIQNHADLTRKQIKDIVQTGMVHCRTHLLWNKLLSNQESNCLTYAEFMELKGLARLENLCDINPTLRSLLNQNITWYQGLAKMLLVKYSDQNRTFISSDGNIQHFVVLHPRYAGAFILLSMDIHTARGDLCAVYREPQKYEESSLHAADQQALLEGFMNFVCFYIWSLMV